jgi:hypothetical protein
VELGPSCLGPAQTRGAAPCRTGTVVECAARSVSPPAADRRPFVGRAPGRRFVGCAEDRGACSASG